MRLKKIRIEAIVFWHFQKKKQKYVFQISYKTEALNLFV